MASTEANLPARMSLPPVHHWVAYVALCVFAYFSFSATQISGTKLIEGKDYIWELLKGMFPPDFSNIEPLAYALLETFQMAFAGTVIGVLISLPLGVLASSVHSPNKIFYTLARTLISLARTVPDLIWALIFVVSVGLGPFAGVLALMMDTIGFAGRFFAEAMEEVDSGPQEALQAIGAGRIGVLFCAVFPASLPSFTNTSLFSLEKATRSSVVLGLVGAGGIGIELKNSMDMFLYPRACAIILSIFVLVLVVEKISSYIRSKIM